VFAIEALVDSSGDGQGRRGSNYFAEPAIVGSGWKLSVTRQSHGSEHEKPAEKKIGEIPRSLPVIPQNQPAAVFEAAWRGPPLARVEPSPVTRWSPLGTSRPAARVPRVLLTPHVAIALNSRAASAEVQARILCGLSQPRMGVVGNARANDPTCFRRVDSMF
jgi:hypothetical protein